MQAVSSEYFEDSKGVTESITFTSIVTSPVTKEVTKIAIDVITDYTLQEIKDLPADIQVGALELADNAKDVYDFMKNSKTFQYL